MMRDIKMGFQIMKYGLSFRSMVVAGGVCLVVSIGFGLFIPVGMSALYLGLLSFLAAQLIFSVSVSTMVQTSPQKKRLQTTIPTWMSGIFLFLCNTLNLILIWIGYQRIQNNTNPFVIIMMEPGELESGILFTSGLMVFIMLYGFFSMKYLWISTIIFIISFYSGFFLLSKGEITYLIMPTWMAVVLSYGVIMLGCVLLYGISCVTYKKDYSKHTFETMLKRAG